MKTITPTLLCDAYKIHHREQYPKGTETVYSTWTPRSSRYLWDVENVVNFGIQGMVKRWLIDYFNDEFFNKTKEDVINQYKRIVTNCLGVANPETKHLEELHDLGYLPIKIKALPEGTRSPIRVPVMTIENTDKRFYWLTNYLETLISNELWKPFTSATIADVYRRTLEKYALETVGDTGFVQFQGHDFSMRGMSGVEASEISGAGHLTSFVGTDTIPAIVYLEAYYHADSSKELIGCSVPATEHSTICAGGTMCKFTQVEEEFNEVTGKWDVVRYI
jgi:nicotinamide phosphoribosyltransferase